ncbi:hypothetical protein G7B40_019725 [Aetokthonos hydrillicola Thurmond2011]|uniref:Uncharacterized protein n=1 Tax=Aetokthonos hydrillicola Thurmond2011 TaxID=2712845 RepID=A0AAP5I8E8_9CYAN|nr:hypothetical protein [Aetokthonos hydrillicola]MBO3462997.1 hypothetical protein [Aetokthonos hydrillicola CCALA 1050]MBW4587200.1 hypothetical protein [Aetokthonos hydrillicola CCALA 1050]MDR9896776.1 hypothetical protein [Aetokthonos hydrillicola Thurmond2011]
MSSPLERTGAINKRFKSLADSPGARYQVVLGTKDEFMRSQHPEALALCLPIYV